MKFNKKYCLLFLMTVLVLLLGAGMVSASEAGSDVQVVKDNQCLSTPDNYDVDNVVQSDKVLTKSEANVEKTSTKDDTKNNNESSIDTFVDTDNTNEDLQTIASGSGHSAKVSVNEISGRTLNVAGLENSELLQETIDVNKISINNYGSLTGSEDMTPILTGETTDSSRDLVDTNTKSSVKSQETDKTIAKVQYGRSTKTDDELPEVVKINITIGWNNEKDTEGFYNNIRYVEIDLYRSGRYIGYDQIDSSTDWNDVFTIDKYDSTGNEYKYEFDPYILRTNIRSLYYDDYYTNNVYLLYDVDVVETILNYNEKIEGVLTNVTEINYILTHTYVPPIIDLNISKNWMDGNNVENTRPANLVINVSNGSSDSQLLELGPDENWNVVLSNLPTFNFDTHSAISYTVNEIVPEGYIFTKETYTGLDDSDGNTIRYYKLYNYLPQNITVKATWVDGNNVDSTRPKQVMVRLKANGEQIGSYYLSDVNNWEHNFTDLPIYDEEGNKLEYIVEQDLLPDYYSSEIEKDESNFIIENTYISDISMTIHKNWNDSDDKDGFRPDELEVQILANGNVYKNITLKKDNNWTCEVTQLPKYIDGNLVTYTVKEKVPEGYTEIIILEDNEVAPDKIANINLELASITKDVATYKLYVTNLSRDIITDGNIVIKDVDGTVILDEQLSEDVITFTRPTATTEIEYDGRIYDCTTIEEFNYDILFSGNDNYVTDIWLVVFIENYN